MSLSRRGFLKALGIGAAAVVAAPLLAAAPKPKPKPRYVGTPIRLGRLECYHTKFEYPRDFGITVVLRGPRQRRVE